jgi:hypothetical protein
VTQVTKHRRRTDRMIRVVHLNKVVKMIRKGVAPIYPVGGDRSVTVKRHVVRWSRRAR